MLIEIKLRRPMVCGYETTTWGKKDADGAEDVDGTKRTVRQCPCLQDILTRPYCAKGFDVEIEEEDTISKDTKMEWWVKRPQECVDKYGE